MTFTQASVTAFYRLHLFGLHSGETKCPGVFVCPIGNRYAAVRGRMA